MDDIIDGRSRVNGWLETLGAATGLALALDEQGVCAVGHASGIDCALEVPADGDTIYLRAPLCHWSPQNPARVAEFCLEAHFLGLETDGASFSIDPYDRELTLWKSLPIATLDGDALAARIVRFLETAAHWRDAVCQADVLPAPGSPDPDAGALGLAVRA